MGKSAKQLSISKKNLCLSVSETIIPKQNLIWLHCNVVFVLQTYVYNHMMQKAPTYTRKTQKANIRHVAYIYTEKKMNSIEKEIRENQNHDI